MSYHSNCYYCQTKNKSCCVCYDAELDELIYQSIEKLSNLSENQVKTLYYGYSCDKEADYKIKKLKSYLKVIRDENIKINLGGEPCLDCINRQRLAEKIRRLTTSCNIDLRKDLIVDRSGVDRWLLNNPTCAVYEKWEELAYKVCGILKLELITERIDDCDIDLEIFTSEEVCNLTFELTKKIIPCDIMVAISVFRNSCDLELEINRTKEECKIDFDILINETNCDLDFKAYRNLIDCNLSFDVIKTIYDNGCSFTVGDPIQLQTAINSYSLDKFNFTGIPDLKALKKLGVDVSGSEYIKGPRKFINKLKSDYAKTK